GRERSEPREPPLRKQTLTPDPRPLLQEEPINGCKIRRVSAPGLAPRPCGYPGPGREVRGDGPCGKGGREPGLRLGLAVRPFPYRAHGPTGDQLRVLDLHRGPRPRDLQGENRPA